MEILNNDAVYKMFLNTLSKMDDAELESALKKAKELLSDTDYQNLLKLIEKEKGTHNA